MNRTTPTPIALATLNGADRDGFVAILGGIFEHSPWVAEAVADARPFASVDDLHRAMASAVLGAPPEQQLALIQAHPELAGKEAADGTLTAESRNEQAGAGLDRCSAQELARLRDLNCAYREKFGFPFVMAVKGRTKHEILQALTERLNSGRGEEFNRCIGEIAKIGRFRLDALVQK
jgi:2-oxo-4-hydroxy-4-carboxy-5-ureidoimidazoline decarboxylase